MADRRSGGRHHHGRAPPPVAVTLESLAPSAEPALCPPTGTTQVRGQHHPGRGQLLRLHQQEAPIVAVLKFFYGLHVPAGTVYMLKPNGKTVVKLAACKKSASGYNTPCVAGKRGARRRPPMTVSTPRTPSTSPVPTRPWAGAERVFEGQPNAAAGSAPVACRSATRLESRPSKMATKGRT